MIDRLATEYLGSQVLRKVSMVRTAGEIRHIKDLGPSKRKHLKDHNFKASDLKTLTKILWQISVSLGHLGSATNNFSRVKSVHISPDGKLGGSGYQQTIVDMRRLLYSAIESLSSIQDTIYDEVSAPHWKPEIQKLPKNDREDVEEMIVDVDNIREDPEAYGEEVYEDAIEDDNEEVEEEDEYALPSEEEEA